MPSEILDTVKNINHIMRLVMNGKELTWGMTDSSSQEFIGIISLRGFEPKSDTGSIELIIDKSMMTTWPKPLKEPFNLPTIILTLDRLPSRLIKCLPTPGRHWSRSALKNRQKTHLSQTSKPQWISVLQNHCIIVISILELF